MRARRTFGAGFTPVSTLLNGPSDGSFFRAVIEAYTKAREERPARAYLYYAEWDALFAIAEADGILSTKGQDFVGPFGWPLLRLWRAMRKAREQAVPEQRFWAYWNNTEVEAQRILSSGSSLGYRPREDDRGRRSREREDPDDEFFTVVVGP